MGFTINKFRDYLNFATVAFCGTVNHANGGIKKIKLLGGAASVQFGLVPYAGADVPPRLPRECSVEKYEPPRLRFFRTSTVVRSVAWTKLVASSIRRL